MLTLYTFGDSILDCGYYNPYGISPGKLLVHNDDDRFPSFTGQDVITVYGAAGLEHRARDGATIARLPDQASGLAIVEPSLAIVTIGGNDLLQGLAADQGLRIDAFGVALDQFISRLPIRPILLGNIYDPTFGDDSSGFLGVDPAIARRNHARMNARIAEVAGRYGALVDLHGHFLTGDPSWFTNTIEPSLAGASEVRRVFLDRVLAYARSIRGRT